MRFLARHTGLFFICAFLSGLCSPGLPALAAALTAEQRAALAVIDSLHAAHKSSAVQEAIEPLLARARAEADSTFLINLLVRRGAEHAAYGDGLAAEPALSEAVSVAEVLPDSALLCSAVRWLGAAVGAQGRSAEAESHSRRLLVLSRAVGDRRHEGWALIGLAYYANQDGRSTDAERDYRQAAGLFQELGDVQAEIWARNGLGNVLSNQGAFDEARECYSRSASLAREIAYPTVEAMAMNNLGTIAFARGDPAVAREHFERAHELFRQLGHLREATIPAANIAFCQAMLGRYEDAVTGLEQALAECREQGYLDLQGSVLNHLAMVRNQQGLHHRAASLYRQTLSLGDVLGLKDHVEGLVGLSGVLVEMDSSAVALAILEAESRDLHERLDGELLVQWEASFGERCLGRNRHEEALAHLRVADGAAGRLGLSGYRVKALSLAARAHLALQQPDSALALYTRAAAVWEAERGLSLDPEWREQRGVTGRLLYTGLASLLLSHPANRPAGARMREAFDRLQVFKARTLLERMLGPGKGLAELAADTTLSAIDLSGLQRDVLKEGEVFLDSYLGPESSLLFAVTPTECRIVHWPPHDELEPRLLLYHELLATVPETDSGSGSGESGSAAGLMATVRAASQSLHDVLLGEIADLLGSSRRVIFATDGPLNLIPMVALTAGSSISASEVQGDVRREWVRVPSATILARLRERSAEDHSSVAGKVLGVAGGGVASEDALPGAVTEVRYLGRSYHGVDVRTLPATGEAFGSEELAAYDVLHFASHVRLDDQYPWHSEIQLRSAATSGNLRAAQIAAMRLPARLAVLSSCESAGGRVLSGEGVLGLSSAFLSAGVPAVIASLWRVDDRVTAILMKEFYTALAAGAGVASALRQAQDFLREDSATNPPFYWAGFVLVGEGDVQVPLATRSQYWPPVLAICAGLALLFALWIARRRARG